MPCRHCKMCRSPLHVDDAHAECVSCLGKSHADSALSGTLFFLPGICAPDWTSGFSQGTIRLSANARPPSLYDELTKLWRTPTRLSSTLQLQLLSHPLTVLKIKDTSTCLLKMNLWLHISARPQLSDGRRRRAIRPSCAEPHLPSLDAPTRWWDKRLQHFTQWLCSRSSRPRCSPVRKPVWIQPLSGTWGAWQTWLYAPPKPPPKPLDARCPAPPLAHDDGDERGNFVRLSRRSDQAACLDQLWRALLNASRRLRSHLRLCDTSSLNAPALPLLPVALDLHRLSRQLNQRQPPWSPDLRRIVR